MRGRVCQAGCTCKRHSSNTGRPRGTPQSVEARAKISAALRLREYSPETRARMRASAIEREKLHPSKGQRFGFKHAPSSIEKMSKAATGRKWTMKRREAQPTNVEFSSVSVGQRRVTERLRAAGCQVLTRGWPDLLIKDVDGTVRAIEVKPPNGRPTPAQSLVFDWLRSVGLSVEIVYESNKKDETCES